ncbi:DUF5606 domain-containing protein [Flavobacterium sp. xlx-214]|uniref:DUF5606 family protein n=1 Tax=unclassified Flavobacterium TaxID=196869 RepID=UPI0013D30DD9|nr:MULTISPECIES: DUF5606 domain-containing protein [unclassified Flavobacterium]MBA5793728.1 DUF5606 domain-containing protein [Flavobacterium sp. xlx-221]QMI83251.1 DUF5606 domain-containing protein [Flavobacterium sp. xlx-214]
MSVEKVLAISGKPGLYELKIQTRSGFIAESLIDGKKLTVGLRSNVSLLSEISIYTETDELKLFEVFARIAKKENNGTALDHKASNDELLVYFGEIVPDFDRDRVYVSDIKKVLNWYNILQKANYVTRLNEAAVTTTGSVTIDAVAQPETVEVEAEEKPKAKRTRKKKEESEE